MLALHGAGAGSAACLWALFAAMTAYNFTSTQIWPALESAISRTPTRMSLSSRMTSYNLTWALSSFAAFSTADAVMALGWGAIFIVPSVASLIACILVWRWAVPEHALAPMEAANRTRQPALPPISAAPGRFS